MKIRKINETERYANLGFCSIDNFKTEVPRGKIYTIEDQIEFGEKLETHPGVAIYDKKLELYYVFQISTGITTSSVDVSKTDLAIKNPDGRRFYNRPEISEDFKIEPTHGEIYNRILVVGNTHETQIHFKTNSRARGAYDLTNFCHAISYGIESKQFTLDHAFINDIDTFEKKYILSKEDEIICSDLSDFVMESAFDIEEYLEVNEVEDVIVEKIKTYKSAKLEHFEQKLDINEEKQEKVDKKPERALEFVPDKIE